jgi:hypothetical protein
MWCDLDWRVSCFSPQEPPDYGHSATKILAEHPKRLTCEKAFAEAAETLPTGGFLAAQELPGGLHTEKLFGGILSFLGIGNR